MNDHPSSVHVHLDETLNEYDLDYDLSWVPVLGPSASMIVRVVISQYPLTTTWSVVELAARCGLAVDSFWRAFGRLQRFGVASIAGTDTLVICRYMPAPHQRGMLDKVGLSS